MTSLKPDRRVNRTRRLLREALKSLILEKGYDSVRIEEITERADLGRTTFYLHYKDKEDLLLESMDAIADDLMDQIGQLAVRERTIVTAVDPSSPILLVFRHAAENADLYRIILRGEGATKTATRFRDIISASVYHIIQDRKVEAPQRITPVVPLEVFSNYFAGAMMGMITWWLEKGLAYSPETMELMFRELFFQGGWYALGIGSEDHSSPHQGV